MRVMTADGKVYSSWGGGRSGVSFMANMIMVESSEYDISRTPSALLVGPRLLATGALSDRTKGEKRLTWDQVPEEFRVSFRQKQRSALVERLGNIVADLDLLTTIMIGEGIPTGEPS